MHMKSLKQQNNTISGKKKRDNNNMEKKTHDMKINWLLRSISIGSLLEGKL